MTPLDVDVKDKLYDKTPRGDKESAMEYIAAAAAQGLPNIPVKQGIKQRLMVRKSF